MASQVLSGSSNVSYTNNTGQNVRIVINYMEKSSVQLVLTWNNISCPTNLRSIGRNLAFASNDVDSGVFSTNAYGGSGGAPTELMLAPGQVFSAICGKYNVVVIPENG